MSTTLDPTESGAQSAAALVATIPVATTVAPVAPAPVAKRERLLSLDVFRGLTIAGMLLVNNPGTWSAIYPPLEHADWNGWTPTDLIFPYFLFIVGITTYLSLTSRRSRGADDRAIITQILKRGGMIVLVGLLLSGLPYHEFVLRLPFGAQFDSIAPHLGLGHWRFTGVLQRIGVAYIVGALLTMRTSLRQQVIIIAALLYGYWFAMTLVPVPGQGEIGALLLNTKSATLGAWLDRTVFGTNHLWAGSHTWDPEGILSTIPAIATCMLGVIAGRWIAERRPLLERVSALFVAGAVGMMVGLMWNWSFPINKNLWTSSFVIFTAGMACVTLATCIWLVDAQGVRWWIKPFVIFGVNPLAAFIGEGVLSRLIYTLVKVPSAEGMTSLQHAVYEHWYASWLPPRDASLLFALCYVLIFLWLLSLLYKRNILIKV